MEPEVNILPPPNREPVYEMTYEDKVGAMLIKMPVGSIFEIAKYVKTENRDKFVEVVKSYIERNFGNREGWEVYFNTAYTKITKAATIPQTETIPQTPTP